MILLKRFEIIFLYILYYIVKKQSNIHFKNKEYMSDMNIIIIIIIIIYALTLGNKVIYK